MQRGEGAKVKLIKPSRRMRLIGIVIFMGLYLLCCGGCLFVTLRFINFLNGPDWPEDFCTVEDNLYQLLAANGEQWANELAERSGYFRDANMTVETTLGQLRLYGERKIGFYVHVIYVPPYKLGKAGYFYTRTGELPMFTFGPEDEFKHLDGKVYCYILDDPG